MTKPKSEPKAPPLPRPDFQAKAPHPEDFAAWCEHPVTRFVAAAYATSAKKQAEAWMAASWTCGEANPLLLMELRSRADAYNTLLETPLEQYAHVLGEN